ncbi:MAG: NADH-quinone oxidoreductase subunit J [candidate division FCPU426 bacterium]
MQDAVFYLTAALMIFCAFRAVTSPFIFRSALYLAATLALTAVQYLLLKAEFVAVVQILVYVGAVVILIIFAVMLTAQLGEGSNRQTNRFALVAGASSLALGFGLYKMLTGHTWVLAAPAAVEALDGSPKAVGSALINSYILPFEIIGFLLFTALVGAVLIARKEPNS